MIKQQTLTDALNFIVENEKKLVGLCISLTKSGNVTSTNLGFYRDVLNDLIETRGHIYDLLAGVGAPSEFLADMTGEELVQHFAEIPIGEGKPPLKPQS